MNDAAQIRRCSGALRANLALQIPNLRTSNREPLRLETHVTHTKQRAAHRSNREKRKVFKSTCRGGPSAPYTDAPPGFRPSFRPSFLPPSTARTPQFNAPASNFQTLSLPKKRKNTKNHPQSLFRLEPTPTVCFLQLTRILNEPMLRLEMLQRINGKRQRSKSRSAAAARFTQATGSWAGSIQSCLSWRPRCFFAGGFAQRAWMGAQVSSKGHGRWMGSSLISGSGPAASRIFLARGLAVRWRCSFNAALRRISSAGSSAAWFAALTNSWL